MRPSARIKKQDPRKNLVWGEVYVPFVPDTHGDFMVPGEIEKAAYKFMENMRIHKIDESHNNKSIGVWVVESFIARPNDPDFVEGSWVVGLQLNDETMEKVLNDEINGFSMEGRVRKEPTIVEIEVPEKIKGTTIKTVEEDHEHEFMIAFQDDGSIIGHTNMAGDPPHRHAIRRATATEKIDPAGNKVGHSHRFDFTKQLKVVGVPDAGEEENEAA